MLLMSKLTLCLSGLLLVCSALTFSIDTSFCSLESLCFDQLSVSDFFIFFLLCLHDREFVFFKHFHASLFKCFQAEHIEHRLNFLIEIKQLNIGIEDLRSLAILLCWHLWLEERDGGSVEIELSGNAHLLSRWLICQVLNVLVSLDEEVLPAHDGLWGGNVAIRVDGNDALWGLLSNNMKKPVIIVTSF